MSNLCLVVTMKHDTRNTTDYFRYTHQNTVLQSSIERGRGNKLRNLTQNCKISQEQTQKRNSELRYFPDATCKTASKRNITGLGSTSRTSNPQYAAQTVCRVDYKQSSRGVKQRERESAEYIICCSILLYIALYCSILQRRIQSVQPSTIGTAGHVF